MQYHNRLIVGQCSVQMLDQYSMQINTWLPLRGKVTLPDESALLHEEYDNCIPIIPWKSDKPKSLFLTAYFADDLFHPDLYQGCNCYPLPSSLRRLNHSQIEFCLSAVVVLLDAIRFHVL